MPHPTPTTFASTSYRAFSAIRRAERPGRSVHPRAAAEHDGHHLVPPTTRHRPPRPAAPAHHCGTTPGSGDDDGRQSTATPVGATDVPASVAGRTAARAPADLAARGPCRNRAHGGRRPPPDSRVHPGSARCGTIRPWERVLVVGGTGPTGVPIVKGLLARGHDVTILHRGAHEDPRSSTRSATSTPTRTTRPSSRRSWRRRPDVRPRDRHVRPAPCHRRGDRGRVGRFVSVGGVPAHRGWMNPLLYEPTGLPVPIAEDGADGRRRPRTTRRATASRRTEERVFEAPPGRRPLPLSRTSTGRSQLAPREWCIVRRILDGRRVDRRRRRRAHPAPPRLHREPGPRRAARRRPTRRSGRPALQRRRRRGAVDPPGDRADRRRARPAARDRLDAVRPRRPGPPAADPTVARPTGCSTSAGCAPISATATRCRPATPSACTARWLAEHPPEPGGTEETRARPIRSTTRPRTG